MFLRFALDRRRSPGFTIVELLIVIVVIAILAAIAIVSYNGVQDRTKATQMISVADRYIKALNLYRAVNNNAYPIPHMDNPPTSRIACFSGIDDCHTSDDATLSAQLLAGVRTQMSGAPLPLPTPYQVMFVQAVTYDSAVNANVLHYYILLQIPPSQTCPNAIAGTRFLNSSLDGNGTYRSCRMAMTSTV